MLRIRLEPAAVVADSAALSELARLIGVNGDAARVQFRKSLLLIVGHDTSGCCDAGNSRSLLSRL